MDRMVFPIEEPDFETFVYDVETLTCKAVDTVCQLLGVPTPVYSLDRAEIDAVLEPLYTHRG